MPFYFQKADKPRRNPLTPEEQALAIVIYRSINNATNKIKVGELAKIIERLDPDTLNRLLKTISLRADVDNIQTSLLDSIQIGGVEAIKEIRKLLPALALPAFLPNPVKVTNKAPMANMDFTNIPVWASPNPPKVSLSISFDKTNPNSLAFATKRAGELVTNIDELTRLSIKKIIIDAFNEQIDVRATARRIKSVVGLHPRWADAVIKFEKREFQRLVRTGIKETTARIKAQERALRYADQLKSKRATMIARTEIQIAQNVGRYEGWKQANNAGLVDPSSMKMWVTAQDERTCEICAPLNGEIVAWNGVFSVGLEAPVVHPHCRCAMVILPPERNL